MTSVRDHVRDLENAIAEAQSAAASLQRARRLLDAEVDRVPNGKAHAATCAIDAAVALLAPLYTADSAEELIGR